MKVRFYRQRFDKKRGDRLFRIADCRCSAFQWGTTRELFTNRKVTGFAVHMPHFVLSVDFGRRCKGCDSVLPF